MKIMPRAVCLLAGVALAAGCGSTTASQSSTTASQQSSASTGSATPPTSQYSKTTEAGFPVYDAGGWTGQSYAQQTALVAKAKGPFPVVSGSTTRGVTSKSITIEGVITASTPGGAAPFPGLCEAVKARFARANREGGVDGRTINFLGCKNDQGSPSQNASEIQQAVQGDHAFAIIPANSVAPQGYAFLNSNHVIYMGGGSAPDELGSPFAFPPVGAFTFQPIPGYGISYPLFGVYAQAFGIHDPSTLRVAFVGDDESFTPLIAHIAVLDAQVTHSKVVYSTTSLPGPTAAPLTDYTTIVSQIQAAKPNLIWVNVLSPQTTAGLISALKSAGVPAQEIMQAVFTDTRIFQSPQLAQAMDGTVAYDPGALPGSTAPGVQEMEADLKAIGDSSVSVSYSTLSAYAGADFLVWALQHHKGPLTEESVVNQLNAGSQYPGLSGAFCGISLPLDHYTEPPCLTFARIDAASKSFVTKLPVTLVHTVLAKQ